MPEDRYVVVIVSKHTGSSHTWSGGQSITAAPIVFTGDAGANDAAQVAEGWNHKPEWTAFVVGLHPPYENTQR